MLGCAFLCFFVLHCALLCVTVFYRASLCRTMLYSALLCFTVLHFVPSCKVVIHLSCACFVQSRAIFNLVFRMLVSVEIDLDLAARSNSFAPLLMILISILVKILDL